MRFHSGKLGKIDWSRLRESKRLKFRLGLAVVIIVILALFTDIVVSIKKFRYIEEKAPVHAVKKTEKKAEKKTSVTLPAPKPPGVSNIPGHGEKIHAKVAIILDDAGGPLPDYKEIYSIREPITISIIPDLPFTSRAAADSRRAGFEVMMHIPMESDNGKLTWDHFGMIKTGDTSDEVKKVMLDAVNNDKLAVGFNNHMGSRVTRDEKVMREVFSSLPEKNLYFIDSKTTRGSVAARVARSMGFRTAENDVFLDGDTQETQIEKRLNELIGIARRKGVAVGIGHATRPATIAVLKKMLPEYEKDGIRFVHASEIVK